MGPGTRASAVWLGMDQAALDKAYNQAAWAPNMAEVLQRYAAASEQVRVELGMPRRLRYGPSEIEALDYFDCGRVGAPVQVFFHGGAWRSGLARDYAFPARLFVPAGVHLVVPDFAWVQDCGGDLRLVVEQARRALAWLHAQAAHLGGDPGRIYLSGHSSGAHLASMLAATSWTARGLPADLIKGAVLCSGSYELEPVRRSSRSSYMRLDDESVRALSPIRHLARVSHPLVVAWGELETPEFQRQGQAFARAAMQSGIATSLRVEPGANHFEVLESLADPQGMLGRAALEQIRSGR
jgi:arylformamidase